MATTVTQKSVHVKVKTTEQQIMEKAMAERAEREKIATHG